MTTGDKRLLRLAALLRTVPRKRFNISRWTNGPFCGKDKEPQHNECGASACAFGWACTIPSFKKAGLHLVKERDRWGEEGFIYYPKYNGQSGFSAAQEFFNITEDEAEILFSEENPNSAKQAAKRIEKLVKQHQEGA